MITSTLRILKHVLYFALILVVISCAPSKKNPYYEKKKKSSHVSASQLGRNRYYFSSDYQKKLNKSFKKNRY